MARSKEDIKAELKKYTEEYKNLKAKAYELYYDPIDFPQEVRVRLSNLSCLKGKLRRELDPQKALKYDLKMWDIAKRKMKENYKKLKAIKSAAISEYPDIVIAEKIISNYKTKKGEKLLTESRFENITAVRSYVNQARKFVTISKKENKVTGHISW